MRTLCAEDLLGIWEQGTGQHPLDRALSILRIAYPEASRETLAHLSIGRRDALLFAVHERSFGQSLQSLTECPACQQRVEFALNVEQLQLMTDDWQTPEQPDELNLDGYQISYRLPNSLDLAAIVGYADEAAARNQLLSLCVLHARKADADMPVAALPATVLDALSSRMAEHDAAAEIKLDLSCPSCDQSWQTLFDIASFLWIEISAQAKRLLREVDLLARAYGWSESEILSLSTSRRQLYLSLVTE